MSRPISVLCMSMVSASAISGQLFYILDSLINNFVLDQLFFVNIVLQLCIKIFVISFLLLYTLKHFVATIGGLGL